MSILADTHTAVDEMARRVPALGQALDVALQKVRGTPRRISDQRAFTQWANGVAAAWEDVRRSVEHLQSATNRAVAEKAEAERRARKEVAALKQRIAELESDLRAWEAEYEPDAAAGRPSLFSNLRRMILAFRH